MGVIFSKEESNRLIRDIQTNLSSAVAVITDLKSGGTKLIQAVDGKILSGAAFTAGKGLFSELILPTIDRCGQTIEEMRQDLECYISANTVIEGISGGISDGIKNKSIGKGVIGGAIDTLKSVGPLEGMTIGATIGAGTGGVVLPVIGDFLKDPIKTWNKGSDLTNDISKFIPKFPKMPKIGFGW
jgi:hypothetical protein